jgi:ribosome biogenesis SPOUT family RNA methylase Rps3
MREPKMHRVMSTTEWLRKEVERLEREIRDDSVFDSASPATPGQLHALRAKVVLHTYLRQLLLRRDTRVRVDEEEYDTQEFVLVRRVLPKS